MWINDFYIYNRHSAQEFLYALGFDDIDITRLIDYLSNIDRDDLQEKIDYYKHEMEIEFDERHYLIDEILNLADNLATGKGGTKVQYAKKLRDLCEEYD